MHSCIPNQLIPLLSYKDIRRNGFHVETHNDNKDEYLFITKNDGYIKQVLENFLQYHQDYIIHTSNPYNIVAYKIIFQNLDVFKPWHDHLGHPGIGMMRKIVSNLLGHHMNTSKFPKSSDFMCTTCAMGKLILRPFLS
jgi:hypothetical protein